MAADGAGRRAGRVEQHGVERAGLPLRGIGDDSLGRKLEAREILPQPRQAGRRCDRPRSHGRPPARAARSCRPAPRRGRRPSCRATSPSRRAGRAAAASCTHQAPSAKPGSCVTGPCAIARTVPVGSTRPPRRLAQRAGSDFTVRSSAASRPLRLRDRARHFSAIGMRPARQQPGRRVERDGVGIAQARSALLRRSAAAPR